MIQLIFSYDTWYESGCILTSTVTLNGTERQSGKNSPMDKNECTFTLVYFKIAVMNVTSFRISFILLYLYFA